MKTGERRGESWMRAACGERCSRWEVGERTTAEEAGAGGRVCVCVPAGGWWVVLRLKIENVSSVNTGFRLIAQFSCQLNDLNKHTISIGPVVLFSFDLIWLLIKTFYTCYVSCSICYMFLCVCVCGPQEESLQPWQLLTWIQLNKQRRKTQRLKASTLSFNVVLDAREYGDSHQQMTINSTK